MKKRILIVDDDYIFRSEFKECFHEFGVLEASNGKEALALLRKPNQIGLIITDVLMPIMDGIELLGRIRKLMPHVSVIMLTGYGSQDNMFKALPDKADYYIKKPLNIDTTRQIITKLLGSNKRDPDIKKRRSFVD